MDDPEPSLPRLKRVPTGSHYVTLEGEKRPLCRLVALRDQDAARAQHFDPLNVCFFRRLWHHPASLGPFLSAVVRDLLRHHRIFSSPDMLPRRALRLLHSIAAGRASVMREEVIQLWLLILYAHVGPLRDALHGQVCEAVEFLAVPYLRHCLLLLLSNRPVRLSRALSLRLWLDFVLVNIARGDFDLMHGLCANSAANTLFVQGTRSARAGVTSRCISPLTLDEWNSFRHWPGGGVGANSGFGVPGFFPRFLRQGGPLERLEAVCPSRGVNIYDSLRLLRFGPVGSAVAPPDPAALPAGDLQAFLDMLANPPQHDDGAEDGPVDSSDDEGEAGLAAVA